MSVVSAAEFSPNSGTYEQSILKRVEYGIGSLNKLSNVLELLGISKVFIVTTTSVATKTNIIDQVKEATTTSGAAKVVDVFYNIGQHAPIKDIRNGASRLQEHDADGVIAVGGGSPIDAGKLIVREHKNKTGKVLRLIAIPTTLSAAECTIGAGYTNEEGKKVTIGTRETACSAVIYDANLSLDTPLTLWLSSGIRALDHAVEQQIRPPAPFPLRALCREAAAILFKALPACASNPKDLNARQNAFNAAWISLWPDNRLTTIGVSHTLGYNIGSPYHIPHGICSVLTLAPTVRVFAKHLNEDELEMLAGLLPYISSERAEQYRGRPVSDRVTAVADSIAELNKKIGLTPTLADYNVPKEDLEGIADRALTAAGRKNDAIKVDIVEALKRLY